MNKLGFSQRRYLHGFAYIEILVSLALLGILLVPAMQALSDGVRNNSAQLADRQLNLRNKMEEMLSQPFNTIYLKTYPSSNNASVRDEYSDPPGSPNRRVVVFYRYRVSTNSLDNNNTGLLFIKVYYETDGPNAALNTLAGKWW